MPEPPENFEDAPRRTHLAAERTQLAWWRTGLTGIAVGLGVGRVIPDIARTQDTWPYIVVGICFTIYGVALIAFGTIRARELEVKLGGRNKIGPSERMLVGLTVVGVILGLASVALIAAQ
ncbi:MAG: DUF202 domain-containing protein [Actinobacteria bacterium]|nr:DUF202 domain-containing protein [Actinomycetota bacterium]